ncbi:hypothetical protein MRY87_03750 [bacterium]|nr:hypothetical protein [bacterium]
MRTILWLLCAGAAGLYVLSPVLDPDLWWHIAIGKWILFHREVPVIEHWNAFAVGKPFRAYSWLPEILFAGIDTRFGTTGLFWAKLVLAQLLALTYFFVFARLSRDWFFGILLGLTCLVSCHNHFTLRPQSFTWMYFALLLLFTDSAVRRERIFPSAFGISAVMCLWANTHITTIIGIAAIGSWSFSPRRIAPTAWLIFFALFGTVLTPYLGAEWLTFFSKTGHPLSYTAIAEFQPATVLQFSTGFLVLSLSLLLLFFFYHPTLFAPLPLVFSGVLALGGFAVIKFLPYAAIFVLAVVARTWRASREEGKVFGNFSEAIEKFQGLFSSEKIPPAGVGFVLACIVFVLIQNRTREELNLSIVPKSAVDFIEEKKLERPILHTFGYGGYLMRHFTDHRGESSEKVMIDGRTNVTPFDVMRYAEAAGSGKRNWRQIIDRVRPKTVLWRGDAALVTLLLLTEEWCIVFEDPSSQLSHTVLIRREEYEKRSTDFSQAICQL